MEFKSYLAKIDEAIRERDVKNEITLAYTDGSYNRTFDGEWTWRKGRLGARVMRGATPVQSIIQWLDGATVDHSTKAIIGEDTHTSAATLIMETLRRGLGIRRK
ncbi:MAG TPA: hypothetical protein VMD07_07055 [Candidatus Acidoferrales bacterium]|nr:hypothetical protein [Candidatus Acidoferrales bacterium]